MSVSACKMHFVDLRLTSAISYGLGLGRPAKYGFLAYNELRWLRASRNTLWSLPFDVWNFNPYSAIFHNPWEYKVMP